jgi:hypothetical protein
LAKLIDFAIDDQVERQGKFMPGSRLEIRPRSALAADPGRFMVLLAVNCESEPAVCANVLAGAEPGRFEFVSVLSPNSALIPS